MEDKDWILYFFEETFLLTDISMHVTLRISFFILTDVKINFTDWELNWGFYTIAKVFSITWQVELVEKKEFAGSSLDLKDEILIVYIATLTTFSSDVYSSHQA